MSFHLGKLPCVFLLFHLFSLSELMVFNVGLPELIFYIFFFIFPLQLHFFSLGVYFTLCRTFLMLSSIHPAEFLISSIYLISRSDSQSLKFPIKIMSYSQFINACLFFLVYIYQLLILVRPGEAPGLQDGRAQGGTLAPRPSYVVQLLILKYSSSSCIMSDSSEFLFSVSVFGPFISFWRLPQIFDDCWLP